LWPHLVRAAGHFAASQIAQVREEHTPTGRHAKYAVEFPAWVPANVKVDARKLTEQEAVAPFLKWVRASKGRQLPSRQRPAEPIAPTSAARPRAGVAARRR
jgi:hypothetical protein